MKSRTILLSMPNDGQSNHYLVNAFQDLGHNILYVDHRMNLQECISHLPKFFEMIHIDLFLCLHLPDGGTYPAEYIEDLKVKSPMTHYAAWIFDTTVNGNFVTDDVPFIKLAKKYDSVFFVAGGQIDQLKEAGINAFHLTEGFSPYAHYPIQAIDQDGKRVQEIDVSFIGQIGHPEVHDDRIEMLEAIAENYNLRIYGAAWNLPKSLVPFHSKRPTYTDVEHNKIVNSSKINIGHSGWSDIKGYMSARNYRITAASGFMIANKSDAVVSTWGDCVPTYKNTEECLSLIEKYIDNEEERNKLAIEAMNITLENHNIVFSLESMMTTIFGEE